MKLLVLSSKYCWRTPDSPSGFATDGGFAFQMRALSELFDSTRIAVPCMARPATGGECPIEGRALTIVPLSSRVGTGALHKASFPLWLMRNGPRLAWELAACDAVHVPIPGDVGTLGMVAASLSRKPLFVRHCGDWFKPVTATEHFVKRLMERLGGGRNVMLATGGAPEPPSRANPSIRWIFSTSLTEHELRNYALERETLGAHGPRLILVGRQVVEKGTAVLVRALSQLADDLPEATLDVVGAGRDLGAFRALADELGIGDRVRFHGNVNHDTVIHLLRSADLFCLPTWSSEGFPKVVVEALACGLPVVTTPVSVLPRLVGTGCGRIVNEPVPEAVAAAVRDCLADPARYREMSARAIATARELSLERWRDTIGELLESAWGPLRADAHAGA
jgi:hypothetical protein